MPLACSDQSTVREPLAWQGWGSTFRALDTTEVLAAYRRARRRAIFLDWGGTLVPIDAGVAHLSTALTDYYYHDLPNAVHHCLQELAADPSNLLMVVSGQEKTRMDQVFRGISGFLGPLGDTRVRGEASGDETMARRGVTDGSCSDPIEPALVTYITDARGRNRTR